MTISVRVFKAVVGVWAVAVLACWVIAVPDALVGVKKGQTVGFGYSEKSDNSIPWGACERIIDHLDPGSPLAAAGVRSGDMLVGRASGALRWDCSLASEFLAAGKAVSIDVRRGSETMNLQVVPQPQPYRSDFLFNNASFFFMCPLVLAMGVLIALRQPAGSSYRWLALYFLGTATGTFGTMGSTSLPPEVAVAGQAIGFFLKLMSPLGFCLTYPTPPTQGWRRRIRTYVWPVLCMVWAVTVVDLIPWGLGRHSSNIDIAYALTSLLSNVCLAIALWERWRCSDGEIRQRFKWIITAFAAFVVFLPLAPLGWQIGGWQLFPVLNPLAALFGLSLLTYAILRHRVFDFGFAVNRTAIYSITTLLLLICFGVLEWGAEHLLQFQSREENLIVDAGVALAVFLAFHRIRDFVEEWLAHLVFRAWHRREDQLRRDFRRIGLATKSQPMLDEMVRSLQFFTGQAGIALYMRGATGEFELAQASIDGLPAHLDQNARVVLAVREAAGIVLAEEFDEWSKFELVLPIGVGHWPVGLAMIGPKPLQLSYRPDECKVLTEVTRHAGECLQALWLLELLQENAQLRSTMT